MPAEHLRDLRGNGLRWDPSDETLECTEPHALTRAAGFLKHVRGRAGARVLYRGQTGNWRPCLPSLFRGDDGALAATARKKRIAALDEYLQQMRGAGAFVSTGANRYDHAHEALLQHYGIKTPWIDLVDNVWVALWFATKCCSGARWRFTQSKTPWAYVLLVSPGPGLAPVARRSGLERSADCELIDLRVAAPSFYTRPHAQHGLLMRKRPDARDQAFDAHIIGTLKVRTKRARGWLGDGHLQHPSVVFPPPHHDIGYRRLLERRLAPPDGLGEIATLLARSRTRIAP